MEKNSKSVVEYLKGGLDYPPQAYVWKRGWLGNSSRMRKKRSKG